MRCPQNDMPHRTGWALFLWWLNLLTCAFISAVRTIVDKIKFPSKLYLAECYTVMVALCSVVSNFLDHPCNRMLVGDLHKHFQTCALAHKLFETCTFGHTHAHTNGHVPTPTVSFCISYPAFPSSSGWRERWRDREERWLAMLFSSSQRKEWLHERKEVEESFICLTVPWSPQTPQLSVLYFQCVCVCFLWRTAVVRSWAEDSRIMWFI